MPKALSIIGLTVSALVLLIFSLDMALGIPFQSASSTMDVGFIICSLVLGYLSWSTMRELA